MIRCNSQLALKLAVSPKGKKPHIHLPPSWCWHAAYRVNQVPADTPESILELTPFPCPSFVLHLPEFAEAP